MKLFCTQENLQRILSYLERVTGRQTSLPILSNVLFETEKGQLKISATNLEIGVISCIGGKIEKEGRVAVPAKLLANFIYNIPQGEVLEIESDEKNTLHISTPSYQMKMKGLDGKDFPIIPQYKESYPLSFSAQQFKNSITKLLSCVSTNTSRIELTGVHILFFENNFYVAATDSFRLAEEKIPFSLLQETYKETLLKNDSCIIPANTLQEILRVITPETEQVFMVVQEGQLFFEIDGVQVISRIINGKYPDYKQIIPKNFSFSGVLLKNDFQRALKIASTFSSYNANEITLSFFPQEKHCVITSQSQEIGENKTTIPIEVSQGATPLTMTFNVKYILDGVNTIEGETIVFSANTPQTPIALQGWNTEKKEKKEEAVYIVMPIRK
ncbi:MAG: DNA polymerase III subunit beta [Candidatus Moranbacteria bacterium]|nr:DNA polymerase III subunit beta [Candidatus Moranbacteria bacterium]